MATKYIRVDKKRFPGVYYYEGKRRVIGKSKDGETDANEYWCKRRVKGKPDVCYFINYKIDGKLKWEKIGWKSEGYSPQIASEIRAERVKKARHGEAVKTHKEIRAANVHMTRTVLDVGLAYFAERKDSLKGYYADNNRFELHIRPLVGGKKISELSELDVAKIKKALADRSPGTIWNVLELLRRIVNYGARTGLSPRLNFTIGMPAKDNEVVEFLTSEEMQRLQDQLDNWPTGAAPRMLKLAMFTGMRRGEIFRLQDKDLDFEHRLIKLTGPKGGKTVDIPMNPIAEEVLKEQLKDRNRLHPDWTYVFPGKYGGQRTSCKAVQRIKEKAGLPEKFRVFHGLRHHFAVTLANSGEFTLDMIGELLTHKSHQMTRRYASFLPDSKQKASTRAAELLQNTDKKNKKLGS
jgi:integrase